MRKIVTLTAAAALVVAFGFAGTAKADFTFPFDGTDLVGYWHFDTNAGTADAVDGSGNGNVGSLLNTATRNTDVPDIVSNTNSVELDGTDDTVQIGDDSALDVTGTLTLAAWVKRDATGGMEIVGKWDNSANQRSYELFFRGVNDRIVIAISPDGGSGNFMEAETTAAFIDTADWHHVAATFDPSLSAATRMKVYFDGVLQTVTVQGSQTAIHSGTGNVHIGTRNGTSNRMDGKIDDVRIYNVALPAGDIQTLAHSFPGTVEKELVSGPNDNSGNPITVTVNPFDAGGVLVLSPDSQHFAYKITITNDGENGALDGLKIFDVVGAEFDPDLDAEDDALPGAFVNPCPDGDDCDGIDAAGTGICTATITPHESGRKLDPHFIVIVLDNLLQNQTCVVTVFVKTDENPSSVRKTGEGDSSDPKEKFSPTSCDLVMAEPDLFNTFTLNEGVKVFDPDSGIRLLGPVDSLQLTCNFP